MTKLNKTHWIGMAGLRGYMPNYCDVFLTKTDAIESLLVMHNLPKKGRAFKELSAINFALIDLHRYGNEYLEVTRCNCNDPWEHGEESISPFDDEELVRMSKADDKPETEPLFWTMAGWINSLKEVEIYDQPNSKLILYKPRCQWIRLELAEQILKDYEESKGE